MDQSVSDSVEHDDICCYIQLEQGTVIIEKICRSTSSTLGDIYAADMRIAINSLKSTDHKGIAIEHQKYGGNLTGNMINCMFKHGISLNTTKDWQKITNTRRKQETDTQL